jgi:hypothetical protein
VGKIGSASLGLNLIYLQSQRRCYGALTLKHYIIIVVIIERAALKGGCEIEKTRKAKGKGSRRRKKKDNTHGRDRE